MSRTLRILAVAVALLLLPAAVADGATRKVPPGFYGAGYGGDVELADPFAQAGLWNRLAEGGVESVRVLFNWEIAQPTKTAPPDWRRNDMLVTSAVTHGMSILPVVEYAPRWAKQFPDKPQSPPKNTIDYTAFLRACIQRYGPNGSFWRAHPKLPKRPIRQWQIWNEPEIKYHWYRTGSSWSKGDAVKYVALLRAARATVRRWDPGAKVVLAALSINSWKNLDKLYKWTAILGQFDTAAVQAYSGTPSYIPTIMRNFRAALDAHGAKNIPIYVTEMTWPAAKGRANPKYQTGYMSGFVTDKNGQAKRLTEGYRILTGMRTQIKLLSVYWYTGVTKYATTNEYEYSGLLTLTNNAPSARPSWFAYQRSASAAQGCAKKPNGACK
jgi:polysaccharide biosynthesis protein PslG